MKSLQIYDKSARIYQDRKGFREKPAEILTFRQIFVSFYEISTENGAFPRETARKPEDFHRFKEILRETFENLRDFPEIAASLRDFADLSGFLRHFLEIVKENDAKTRVLLTFLLHLQGNLPESAISGNFRRIFDEFSSDLSAEIAIFSRNSENFKLSLRQSTKVLRRKREKVRQSLENQRISSTLRNFHQEFLNKVQLSVCVTNLSGRKGYLKASLFDGFQGFRLTFARFPSIFLIFPVESRRFSWTMSWS